MVIPQASIPGSTSSHYEVEISFERFNPLKVAKLSYSSFTILHKINYLIQNGFTHKVRVLG